MKCLIIIALISAVAYASPTDRDGQYRIEENHRFDRGSPWWRVVFKNEEGPSIEEAEPRMKNMDWDTPQHAEEIVRGLSNTKMERDLPSSVEGECVEDSENRDSATIVEEDEHTIIRQVPLLIDRALERAVPRPVARTRPRPASPAPIDRTVADNRDGTGKQRLSQRNEQLVGLDAREGTQNPAERKCNTRTCLDLVDETGRCNSLDREYKRERC